MPINCPLALPGLCQGCRKLNLDGDKCTYSLPPVPIRDILTPDERIDALELLVKSYESVVPSRVISHQLKLINSLKGQLINLTNKYNDHIDSSKKKRKPRVKSRTVEV